jgi:tetratricopeptide (TPR) repeat protein
MGSKRRFSAAVAGIFAAALAVRLIHVWQISRAPFFSVLVGDARGYDDWARQLAAGDWIGKDVFYQAPLYPYFLGVIYAVAGHSLMAVRLVQAVLGSSACVLLAVAGRRFFSPLVGVIAGAALALYAPAIFFDGLIQKSVLDVFLVCVSLCLLGGLLDRAEQTFSWLWLGVALGALALTRENALVLIAVVAVWAGLSGTPAGLKPRTTATASALVCFGLGLGAALLPVAARNYAVGGGFYLTTSQFGTNFYIGNNPRADGTYVALKEGRGSPEFERQDATDLAQAATGHAMSPADVSSYWTGRTLHYIASEPGAWTRLMARKLMLLVNRTEAVDTESQETYAEWSTPLEALGWIGHFGVLVPLALFGAVAAWPGRKRIAVLYALTISYGASVLLFYVFARYRFPLVPMLLLFAAEGAVALPAFVRAVMPSTRKLAVAAAVAAAAVCANWPVLSAASMQAVTENNLGTAFQGEGRLPDAVSHYQRAIALDPAYEPALNNLGTALRESGDTKGAIAIYRRALESAPASANAHFNLGNALLDADQVDDAMREFTVAASLDPRSVDIQNNLGIAFSRAGKNGDAAAAFTRALAVDPGSATAHKNLADLHYDQGVSLLEARQFEEAVEELRRALALEPAMVEAHNNLGAALAYEGKTVEAVAEFRRALTLDPKNENALQNLAAVQRASQPKR